MTAEHWSLAPKPSRRLWLPGPGQVVWGGFDLWCRLKVNKQQLKFWFQNVFFSNSYLLLCMKSAIFLWNNTAIVLLITRAKTDWWVLPCTICFCRQIQYERINHKIYLRIHYFFRLHLPFLIFFLFLSPFQNDQKISGHPDSTKIIENITNVEGQNSPNKICKSIHGSVFLQRGIGKE